MVFHKTGNLYFFLSLVSLIFDMFSFTFSSCLFRLKYQKSFFKI